MLIGTKVATSKNLNWLLRAAPPRMEVLPLFQGFQTAWKYFGQDWIVRFRMLVGMMARRGCGMNYPPVEVLADGYADPLNYELGSRQRGQFFIHELTHAWQIKNTRWEISLTASASASKICEVGGGDPYDFGTDATKPFSDFNLE